MSDYELGLYENALSSLREALTKFSEAQEGEAHSYKFAISHLSHTLELLFKHYIADIHPLLIYKNPFSDKLNINQTIGMWEAVNFLKNSGAIDDKQFSSDLEYIKKVRNNIEHFKFSIDTNEAERNIGRLFHTLKAFSSQFNTPEIAEIIESPEYGIFEEASLSYEEQLKEALEKVELAEAEAQEGMGLSDIAAGCGDIPILECPECGEETLIPNKSSPTGWQCTFCDDQTPPEHCERCGEIVESYLGGHFCQSCINYIDHYHK